MFSKVVAKCMQMRPMLWTSDFDQYFGSNMHFGNFDLGLTYPNMETGRGKKNSSKSGTIAKLMLQQKM